MLSTLTIISIFTEIFAAGILLAGAYSFGRKFLIEKKRVDLFLTLTFLAFALYAALTVTSQMMFNYGRSLFELILIQKLIAADLVIGAWWAYLFLAEKFGFKARWIGWALGLGVLAILGRIFLSSVNLIYRADVIEPLVDFSLPSPIKSLWVGMWALLSISHLWFARKAKKIGRKNLLRLTAYSAALLVLAYVGSILYIRTGEASYLLASWIVTLGTALGFFLGNIISEESDIAHTPLNYFRTRLLYKLILIFVLLIVILLEATTLATINISKSSLSKAIISRHHELASKLGSKIEYYVSDVMKSLDLVATPEYLLTRRGKSTLEFLLDTNPILDSVEVINPAGTRLLSSTRKTGYPLPKLKVKDIYRELKQQAMYISPVEQVADKSFYTITAVRIKGKPEVLVARINLKVIQRLVERTPVAYLVDREGRLFAHPDIKRAAAREDFSQISIVKKVMAAQSGGEEFFDKIGNKVVGAYIPIKGLGWGVVVQEPIQEAYFELRQVETNSLLFVIVGIILTVFTGIFFARGIEKSIREVIAGTEDIRKGDLTRRIKVGTVDEIGELAKAFNQMTADLKESQDHLVASEKLAALGTMAAGMAHEIKNPLVSLRTFTQLLTQKFDDPEFRKKFVSVVPLEIDRINKIAENLLRFGRPTKPEFTRAQVNNLLQEVLGLFENECKKYNIRVTTKFAELPEITADGGQLSQAFINILLNSIQAMSRGGELTVKTDVGQVTKLGPIRRKGLISEVGAVKEISWGEAEEEVKPTPVVFIEITDTGGGIPEESLKNIFDPFFSTKTGGTGMGLPITLRIVEDHKGSIKVRSQLGKGTNFIITLPQEHKAA